MDTNTALLLALWVAWAIGCWFFLKRKGYQGKKFWLRFVLWGCLPMLSLFFISPAPDRDTPHKRRR